MSPGGFVLSVGTISLGITLGVDLLRRVFDRADRAPSWVWTIAPFAIGVGIAYGLGLPLAPSSVKVDGLVKHIGWWQSCLITGISLGGGASGHHSWLDFLSTHKRYQQAVTMTVPAAPAQDDPGFVPEPLPAEVAAQVDAEAGA